MPFTHRFGVADDVQSLLRADVDAYDVVLDVKVARETGPHYATAERLDERAVGGHDYSHMAPMGIRSPSTPEPHALAEGDQRRGQRFPMREDEVARQNRGTRRAAGAVARDQH